ncbi:hypothetical protein DVH24_005227 [Malus domestica]|uniref:J domain-containing protein n=1 Tax=Malus domestica TaxID=3750 RepID=A0A498IJ86_MALDO|nr:hypothetical protein DVH24_005227 [Malus domestica]
MFEIRPGMKKLQKITQYRERLDRTLASPSLSDEEALKTLVKNQLIRSLENENEGCNENMVEEKTAEVSNLLDMLRSASLVNDKGLKTCETTTQPEWKLKHDNEEFRVMYREGIEGSPFHTLLAEGYVDGPVDVCLCISWESDLYKKWWPESTVPTFKILSSKCLKKVRIGEQISLVRMKIPWPLSAREAAVHYFMFEYFQDDLIVVLFKSISDLESIDDTHCPTNEATAGAKDAVRIDMVGGFALQKVTNERSYFRTISSTDIKMDFVPPSLLNFISRQLIGNGLKLYQKVVSSKLNCNDDYSKALSGPLYSHIREALFSRNKSNGALEEKKLHNDTFSLSEEHLVKDKTDESLVDVDQKVDNDHPASGVAPEVAKVIRGGSFDEIEEVESDESRRHEVQTPNRVVERERVNGKGNVLISSEVEQALGTLEKVIYKVRQNRLNAQKRSSSGFTNGIPPKENNAGNPKSLEGGVCGSGEHVLEASKEEFVKTTQPESARNSSVIHNSSNAGSNSLSKDVNPNRVLPTSLEQELSVSHDSNQVALLSSNDGTTETPAVDHTMHRSDRMNSEINGDQESRPSRTKKSRQQKALRLYAPTMSTKKLLTPLSAILRRTLTPTTALFTFNSSRNFQSPAFFSSSVEADRRLFPFGGFCFPGNHRIPGKCFVSSQSAEKADAKCWNCSASPEAVPFLLCSCCRCIQPVDKSVDYFQIFGLERKYDTKVDDLEGKYKAWQKKLHPDLVHTKSEKEREYAAEQSARVIDAYRTLSQSLARAIYILKLEGVDVDEEETLSESELLTEILEIREAVEEAADSQALNEIQSQMKEKLKHWSDVFTNAFRSRNFGEALKAIRRMTYYERVNESVVKKQLLGSQTVWFLSTQSLTARLTRRFRNKV